MKIVIISDTHGSYRNADKVVEKEWPFDRLIHLGDVEVAPDYLPAALKCPVDIVMGNNDYALDLPMEKVVQLSPGHRALLTHGHRSRSIWGGGPDKLLAKAREVGADLILCGHTHVPAIEQHDGIILANPGSLTYPRTADRKRTYLVLTIDEEEKLNFELKSVK